MGLGSLELRLCQRLFEQGLLKRIPGRPLAIMEIGAQQLTNDFLSAHSELDAVAALAGVPTRFSRQLSKTTMGAGGGELLAAEAPLARDFWESLGFTYAAIDVDGSPGSIPLDLNVDQTPSKYRGRYDFVTNAGTTEHVANQLNAMKIIHDLTKVGGIMLHRLPAQGFLNHGLINYNLKFFWALSRSCVYKWIFMDFEANPQHTYDVPRDIVDAVKEFSPDIVERLSSYRVSDCAITVIMQKTLDIDFVPPLDVPASASTSSKSLHDRYWTVFDQKRVEATIEAAKVRDRLGLPLMIGRLAVQLRKRLGLSVR